MKRVPIKERLVNEKTIDRYADKTAVSCVPLTAMYVTAHSDSVEFGFTQYMNISDVSRMNVQVYSGGVLVAGTIEALNAEADPTKPGVQYASKFRFVPAEGTTLEQVSVSIDRVTNYAGTAIQNAYGQAVAVETKIGNVSGAETADVDYGMETELELTLDAAIAGKTITVTSSSPAIVSIVTASVVTDESGKAVVKIKGNLPGSATISYSVDGTDIQGSTNVTVGAVKETVKNVYASVANGSEVEEGTLIQLFCDTPDAEIYYTTDGSDPRDSGNINRIKYTDAIVITEETTITAYAVKEGCNDSNIQTFTYTIKSDVEIGDMIGDVDKDGVLTVDDITALRKYLTGGWNVQIDLTVADIDGNGKINAKDATLLNLLLAS